MEDLLLVIIVFVVAMCVILVYVLVRNESSKEEFNRYMKHLPERNRKGMSMKKAPDCK